MNKEQVKQTIAYKQGRKAAELGVPLERSGLVNLNPDSERYDQFIAGYDSVTADTSDSGNSRWSDTW